MSTASKPIQPASGEISLKTIALPLAAIIVGMFMVILDGTAMNVALAGLMNDFQASLTVIQWTVTGYTLAQAAVIPLSGWLSDRFGAKNIFLISIALFTIGSALCAMATNAEQLVIYRVIQGLGGGMVSPIAMAFTFRLSPPDKVGSVMGMIGIPMLLAPALGPVVAGWLVDYATWHWIFLINVPIGIVAVFLGLRTLPKIDRQTVPALDWLGMIFGPLAFAMLAYGVSSTGGENGSGSGWTSPEALIGMGVGLASLLIFVFVELRRRQPLLELRVFGSGNFTRGIIVSWITQMALMGTMFLVPLLLQQTMHYTAFETGLMLIPQALAAGVFMPIGGKLYDKIGARPLVIVGLTIIGAGVFMLSQFGADSKLIMLIIPLVMLGAGMGLSMMSLNTHIIQSAPPQLVSRVTSLTAAAQMVISSFAVAGFSSLLANRITTYMAEAPGPDAVYKAYGYVYIVEALIAVLGIVLAMTLSKPKRSPESAGDKVEVPIMVGH